MAERNYRDAVHNLIRVETSTEAGALIARLIDAPEFQRLRRIRQLGLAYFAYQTAEHSRFTHSIGAYHLASRLIERLAARHTISEENRLAVRVAALLHDVGHGPFSHVIESILGFHHEMFTIEAVLSDETAIGAELGRFSPNLKRDVAAIVHGDFRPMALGQIVSSQLDVDRMDYLLRDSMMTGVKYGVYDLEWVLKSIEIDEEHDRLSVQRPGLYAVEDYLQARYYMFRQVYFHRTLRAAESLLDSIFRRAFEHADPKDIWFASGSAFESVLKKRQLSLREHLSMDDTDILFHIKSWRGSADPVLSDLCSRFLDRRIFKALDIDLEPEAAADFYGAAREAVAAEGFDPEYYFAADTAAKEPYFFYSDETAKPKDQIFVSAREAGGAPSEISTISPAVRGLQRVSRIQRACFAEEARPRIEALYRELSGGQAQPTAVAK